MTHLESLTLQLQRPRNLPEPYQNGPLQQPANKIDIPPVHQRSTDSYLVHESRPTAYLDSRFWPMWVGDGVPPGSINATNAISISGIVARSRRINCRGTRTSRNYGKISEQCILFGSSWLHARWRIAPQVWDQLTLATAGLLCCRISTLSCVTDLRLDDCHVFESNKRD